MTTAIGQTITDVITLRRADNSPILGVTEFGFTTLEFYQLTSPLVTEPITLTEINDGQYSVSMVPSDFGDWIFHYVYEELVPSLFLEESRKYTVVSTNEVVVVSAGGTWTYSGDMTDPSQVVRFMIQDTDESRPLFVDTEIAYALGSANGSTRRAASTLVERLMARYAAMADTTELDLSVRASQLYEHYKDLHKSLNSAFSGLGSVMPYAGGISNADIDVGRLNPDRRSAIFDKTTVRPVDAYGGIRH